MNADKSLHIALVFDGFDQGGIGKVNLTLAKWFLGSGYRVDLIVFSSSGPRKSQVPEGARVIDLKRAGKIELLRRLFDYFRKNNPDAVFVANAATSVYIALARFMAWRSSCVVGIHHTNVNTDYLNKSNRLNRLLISNGIKFAVSFLGLKLAGVSEGVRLALSQRTGVELRKVGVLYNPVVLDAQADNIPEELKAWWNDGDCKLLSVGRLTPEKGFVTLLKAITLLRGKHAPRLVIVGYGPYEAEIQRILVESELKNNVRLVGFHPNPRAFFEQTDIFVSASVTEAFSLTLVEALYFGKPVISTDCDFGPREILGNGKWGRLVPVNDAEAFAEAIKETILLPGASDFLISRSSYFSPEITIQKYLELIET